MNPPPHLNRREAIARLAWLMGGAIVGAQAFLRGETAGGKTRAADWSASDRALLDEIGETIIPTTATPGAKAAGVGAFISMMVTDCYDDAHQAIFYSGLVQLEAACRALHGRNFLDCTPAERTALLAQLDGAARQHHAQHPGEDAPPHYFRLLKQLTLLGYFTSEIGCTQALRYVEVPGDFRGSEPYHRGDRAWYNRPSPVL
jgi:hypothetical protein